jgi:hypothetical protein
MAFARRGMPDGMTKEAFGTMINVLEAEKAMKKMAAGKSVTFATGDNNNNSNNNSNNSQGKASGSGDILSAISRLEATLKRNMGSASGDNHNNAGGGRFKKAKGNHSNHNNKGGNNNTEK